MAWWLLWPVNFDKIQNHLGETSSGMSVKVISGRFKTEEGRHLLEDSILSGGRQPAEWHHSSLSTSWLQARWVRPPHIPIPARPPYHDGLWALKPRDRITLLLCETSAIIGCVHAWRQRAPLWNWLSPPTCMWAPPAEPPCWSPNPSQVAFARNSVTATRKATCRSST